MTMTRRDGPARMARLQTQMHRLTQYRLTELHRRQAELRAAERAAVAALDDGVGADHGAGRILHRRLRLISVELRETAAQIAVQARVLAEQARRARTAETIAERLALEAACADERKTLSEIVEAAGARAGASPP